jgi:hypothetical protein
MDYILVVITIILVIIIMGFIGFAMLCENEYPWTNKIYLSFMIPLLFCVLSITEFNCFHRTEIVETRYLDIQETRRNNHIQQFFLKIDYGEDIDKDDFIFYNEVYDIEKFHVRCDKELYISPNWINNWTSWVYSEEEKN